MGIESLTNAAAAAGFAMVCADEIAEQSASSGGQTGEVHESNAAKPAEPSAAQRLGVRLNGLLESLRVKAPA